MAALNFLLSLLSLFALLWYVSGQNPSGFISIDCGLPTGGRYEEPNSGIIYDSDETFIESGTVHNISSNNIRSHTQQLWSLRSFPKGTRNCYTIGVKAGTKYLIRASFLYGNYDGRKQLPVFNLHFGPNFWTSVDLDAIDTPKHLEIISVVSLDYAQVCLINNGSGTPFISAIELRPLRNMSYPTPAGSPLSMSFANFLRLDVGSLNNQSDRFKDDSYDRIWAPMAPLPGWNSITTSDSIKVSDSSFFLPPAAVMQSAVIPRDASAPLNFHWDSPTKTTEFFMYFYFSELQELQSNESREFDIILNGKTWSSKSISPNYLNVEIVYSTVPLTAETFNLSIVKTPNSTLPPIFNAFEAYSVINFFLPETDRQDVEAISNIKKVYGVERNWQGDPCAPKEFTWQGVNCSYVDSEPPRITSLDLSSSGITGKIAKEIANLMMLETLNLSNNNLSGTVPEFLAQLPSLKVLNLERNRLSGLIPSQLIENFNDKSLSFSFGENPNLFITAPSEEKKRNFIVLVVASIGGFFLLLFLTSSVILWIKTKQTNQQAAVTEGTKQNVEQSQQWCKTKKCYSYSDILRITNNFERPIGEGGFGRVYYGQIGDTEVAVKMLSLQSAQGYQQFQAEVDILTRVHHKNLTGLVGYCNESTKKGLIYEYMGGGNLGYHISGGRSSKVLNWKNRLLIAVDAAHGLEYLHSGIKPAIIHRDVKSTNILLDNNFRAKVSDFGLSKVFPTEGGTTQVITNVVGTPGYIDPEYQSSFKLHEKSDVYGFGVILLEIITGKPALIKIEDQTTHVSQWVQPWLSRGNIQSIIDSKMEEDLDVNSVWKAVEIAMFCVSLKSVDRPNMSQVLVELKECLTLELARHNHSQPESVAADSSVLFGPLPR